jgi:hypothetical protein
MAKKVGRKAKSVSSYFRKIFTERPEWLEQKSNNDVLARYRADHKIGADKDVDQKIKNNLANLKSQMRKELREGGGAPSVRAVRATGAVAHKMEHLEELIDDCLSTAKNLDAEGLKSVIRSLRAARNEIVWKLGQP